MKNPVTPLQRREFLVFWQNQAKLISDIVSENTMYWFRYYTSNGNVGFEQGQLRPGKLGQWDLYNRLIDREICDEAEALFASGLTAEDVSQSEDLQRQSDSGLAAETPVESVRFERLRQMTRDEFEAEIARVERELGLITA